MGKSSRAGRRVRIARRQSRWRRVEYWAAEEGTTTTPTPAADAAIVLELLSGQVVRLSWRSLNGGRVSVRVTRYGGDLERKCRQKTGWLAWLGMRRDHCVCGRSGGGIGIGWGAAVHGGGKWTADRRDRVWGHVVDHVLLLRRRRIRSRRWLLECCLVVRDLAEVVMVCSRRRLQAQRCVGDRPRSHGGSRHDGDWGRF